MSDGDYGPSHSSSKGIHHEQDVPCMIEPVWVVAEDFVVEQCAFTLIVKVCYPDTAYGQAMCSLETLVQIVKEWLVGLLRSSSRSARLSWVGQFRCSQSICVKSDDSQVSLHLSRRDFVRCV